ncbi:MAG: ribbon-helix-helix protein, CopG family [Oscillospiraceae bacterium]|nr:ribbon-helix-helix protein, CopG family [Oscillospiraceae bacterium]
MKPLKIRVSLTLDEDVAQGVRALAEMDDRSYSQYINLLLREHLNQQEKKEEK